MYTQCRSSEVIEDLMDFWLIIVMDQTFKAIYCLRLTLKHCKSISTMMMLRYVTPLALKQKFINLVRIIYMYNCIYTNEFNMCTKKHTHCLTVFFYYVLGNLSPRLRSSLKAIQLLAVTKCSVVNKYGSNVILHSFMEDIKVLEKSMKYMYT